MEEDSQESSVGELGVKKPVLSLAHLLRHTQAGPGSERCTDGGGAVSEPGLPFLFSLAKSTQILYLS